MELWESIIITLFGSFLLSGVIWGLKLFCWDWVIFVWWVCFNRKLRQKLGTWRKRLVHYRRDWKRGMHSYKLQQLLLRRSHSYTILFNFVSSCINFSILWLVDLKWFSFLVDALNLGHHSLIMVIFAFLAWVDLVHYLFGFYYFSALN